MNSKTSFSKGLFKNDIKRFKWMGLAYFLALFLLVPLRIILIYNDTFDSRYYNQIQNIFRLRNDFQIMLMVAVPILLGVLIFRYLQVSKNSDFIHCLPYKRESIFINNILIGTIVLIVPILLNALLSIILHVAFGLGDYFSVNIILWWAGITILMNLVIFSISVFTGIITGISTLQGILSFIFLFLPIGLGILVLYNLEKFLFGFYYNRNIEDTLLKFSPVARIIVNSLKLSVVEIISYIGVIIILLIASTYLYKKRKLEAATQSIVFDWLKPIFKYGITFSTMTIGGIYFGDTQGRSISWVIFGYVVGSLIGYIVAEMIIRKSFNIIKYMKGYIIYALVIVVLLIGVKMDIIGYQSYIPDIQNIKSANLGDYNYYNDYNYNNNEINLGLKNPTNIKAITELHKEIINNKDLNSKHNYRLRKINFIYYLENGKVINRGYDIRYEDYLKLFKPVYESLEYKILINTIFKTEKNKVDKMSISLNYANKPALSITDNDEINEAIEMLKEDIKNETYEEMNSGLAPWSSISFLLNDDKRINVSFKKNYIEFEKWLIEKGYYENSRIMAEEISKVKIISIKDREELNYKEIEIEQKRDENIKVLEIKDKEQIENLLRNRKESWTENRKYQLEFFDQYDRMIFSGVLDDYIPEYIEDFFRKK